VSTLVLFNKPYGVLCQFSPGDGRPTLKDYLPQRDVYPAGRLDADSEGLVLLTADGALQHRIADPRHKLSKIYCVQVEGIIDEPALKRLRYGVDLRGYTTRPALARATGEPSWLWPRVPPIRMRRHIPTSWVELTLAEGKNRQVRRMTAAVGFPTLRLVRRAIGPWTIDGLRPGEWREAKVTHPPAASRARSGGSPRRPRSTVGPLRR
jgi:23S rRNA pseudouridine2457 synthase